MSKIFKCISLVLVLVMMLSMTTFAASISTPAADADKDARTVKVSGTVADAVANQQVVILVLKSTANLQSVSDADIAYVDQIAAGTDGKFEFNWVISMNLKTDVLEVQHDIYYIFANAWNSSEFMSRTFN